MAECESYHSYFGVRCRTAHLEGSRSLKVGGAEGAGEHCAVEGAAVAGTLVGDSGRATPFSARSIFSKDSTQDTVGVILLVPMRRQ